MKVYITEKPKQGIELAKQIGITNNDRDKNYVDCTGDIKVTWCIGHILEQKMPDDYREQWEEWNWEYLPMVPDQWEKTPEHGKKGQFNTIQRLGKKADVIVHAGDPDREGQLIVDEVLEECGFLSDPDTEIRRIRLTALDERSIQRALDDEDPNSDYAGLRDAARARERADWLVGLNMTRVMTMADSGDSLLSVGRVQTPTLALVVQRDRTIEQFDPETYYVPKAYLESGDYGWVITWEPTKKQYDEENPRDRHDALNHNGRITDEEFAQRIMQDATGSAAEVMNVSEKTKSKKPEKPFKLSSLQKVAGKTAGLSADETLEALQSLYDAGYTTYPRTDTTYLPEEQKDEAPRILNALADTNIQYRDFIDPDQMDPERSHPAWNSSKIDVHHGIIPTEKTPDVSQLSGDERTVYNLVTQRYIQLFYPDYVYLSQIGTYRLAGQKWVSKRQSIKQKGWRVVGRMNNVDPDEYVPIEEGQSHGCTDTTVEEKETSPPDRFTEGSLANDAMANIHKFVELEEIMDSLGVDESTAEFYQNKLEEAKGIGTQATRSRILEKLKNRDYITSSGKSVQSTKKGRMVIDRLPNNLTNPVMTGLWESLMEEIAQGERTVEEFLDEQTANLEQMIEEIQRGKSGGTAA